MASGGAQSASPVGLDGPGARPPNAFGAFQAGTFCHLHNHTFIIYCASTFWLCTTAKRRLHAKIDSFYCFKKIDNKFPMGALPIQLFGPGCNRPHHPHGVDAYVTQHRTDLIIDNIPSHLSDTITNQMLSIEETVIHWHPQARVHNVGLSVICLGRNFWYTVLSFSAK